ncbi:plasmid replication protein RepC [Acidiphilium acidophilum]|uniref:Plasmid replication protein RepC n=1 Tax=Acidiphilium acidophilum TaxID=76588 RepID=A0AAW9DK82_ACIAO|nr:plasmid replication protein RepC [Acidiphilium acidophilum]MDX5929443.1 plasmid replication protein RepC [Acidiphilium acidophilum]
MEIQTGSSTLIRKSSTRRLTPRMIPGDQIATSFTGTDAAPAAILGAFKAAAPHMGIGPRIVHAIDWLFRFTQPQDWREGSRPIVWPSAALQAQELCITPTHAKRLNRHLAELGLIVMKDSPNGKRYGRRFPAKTGRIIEAYGFDLSPLAVRMAEFIAAAETGRAERAAIAQLRRRASIARNSLRQTFETYREQEINDPEIPALKTAFEQTAKRLRDLDTADKTAPIVAELESLAATARAALEISLRHGESLPADAQALVNMSPKGHQNVPHQYSYKPTLNPIEDTVTALESSSGLPALGAKPTDHAGEAQPRKETPTRTDSGSCGTVTPDEIVRLAPKLRPYLTSAAPRWPDLVEAADWLRHDLGVSKPLWGDACLTIGRERAAIALAIVSAKPAGHFKSGPAGYFHGMIAKAKAGELNLDRTIWALRRQKPKSPSAQCQ